MWCYPHPSVAVTAGGSWFNRLSIIHASLHRSHSSIAIKWPVESAELQVARQAVRNCSRLAIPANVTNPRNRRNSSRHPAAHSDATSLLTFGRSPYIGGQPVARLVGHHCDGDLIAAGGPSASI